MTVKEFINYSLIEINKVEAPSMLLDDTIYLVNKAVQQYCNKSYNRFDTSQQDTDNLRVLQSSVILGLNQDKSDQSSIGLLSNTYVTILPKNYLHILNCLVEYKDLGSNNKCDTEIDQLIFYPASKLTADMYPTLLTNAYMKPSYKRPFYFIHNISDINGDNLTLDNEIKYPNRDKPSQYNRTSNVTDVRLEIRYGSDKRYEATRVYLDYIKSPMRIEITEDELSDIEDTTQMLEFPDYVCYEIINEFVKLVMENASDPRLQTNPVVNQTIATQAQQN